MCKNGKKRNLIPLDRVQAMYIYIISGKLRNIEELK